MKKVFIFLGMIGILVMSGCGSSVRVFHDLDPTASFEQYKTYSFLDWTDGNLRTVSERERELIRIAVAREIEAMGLTYQERDADIKIQLTVYFRNARRHYSHHYGYPGPVFNYMERAITVDMFESESKMHFWHSAALESLERNEQERAEELPGIASRLFEDYPMRKDI